MTIGDGGFAAKGLVNFEFDAGPGSDTLTIATPDISLPDPMGVFTYDAGDDVDTIATAADGDFTLTDDLLTAGAGGSVVLLNLKGEIANLSGGNGDGTLTVQQWSGTGTLNGMAGNDNFVFGTAGDIDTVTGRFTVIGGDGNDTLTLDDSASSDNTNYDVNASDVEIDPSTPEPFGGVDFDGTLENIVLTGTTGDNKFFVTPNVNTLIHINGNSPPYGTLPPHGDTLKVDFTGTSGRKLITNIAPKGPGNGARTFTDGHQPVLFTSIEKIQSSFLAASADTGQMNQPLVNVFDSTSQQLVASFYPLPQTFRGGVRVVVADVNGDGVPDVITAPGVGKVPGVAGDQVRVYDGATLVALGAANAAHLISNPNLALLSVSLPEGPSYTGGLFVAAGDVNHDGTIDLVTSRSTGTSLVRVYLNAGAGNFNEMYATLFSPYNKADNIVSGGALIAVGDVNGDGFADIVTAPGPGHQVKLKLWDVHTKTAVFMRQFLGFPANYNLGVSLAVGDINADGVAEIMVGAGAGGGSQVRVLNSFGGLIKSFKAYTSGNVNSPVRLALRPVDDRILLYAAQSNDGRSHEIRLFDPLTGTLVDNFFEFNPDFNSGIFLG